MDCEANRLWERPVALWTALLLLFAVSFTGPVVVAMGVGGFFQRDRAQSGPGIHFPSAIDITAQGSYLRVPHTSDIIPSEGKDFAFFIWVNLRRSPAAGQRLLLLSKYEAGTNALPQRGYALALRRDGDAMRAVVFWGDLAGGRWLDFPDVKVEAKRWVMLGFSLHDRRKLGAYIKEFASDEVRVLGGHDLGPDSGTGMGDADLVVGAFRDRPFRGQIGPLLIAGKHGLSDHLPRTLGEFSQAPLELPPSLDEKDVRLWLPAGPKDESPHKAHIEVVRER